jgi:hypothetical protein
MSPRTESAIRVCNSSVSAKVATRNLNGPLILRLRFWNACDGFSVEKWALQLTTEFLLSYVVGLVSLNVQFCCYPLRTYL